MHVNTVIDTGYGQSALGALRAAVADAKSLDPMTMVTVVVPSDTAGIAVRRTLATGVRGRRGIAALKVTTLIRLAEEVVVNAFEPISPASRAVETAATRSELERRPLRFVDADYAEALRRIRSKKDAPRAN